MQDLYDFTRAHEAMTQAASLPDDPDAARAAQLAAEQAAAAAEQAAVPAPAAVEPPPAAPEAAQPPAPPPVDTYGLSPGLAAAVEQEAAAAPVEPPAATPASDPAPAAAPASQHVPIERLNEVIDDRNRLRAENETLMRQRLAELDAARAPAAPAEDAPPELTPEVRAYMTNTLKALGIDPDEYHRLKQSMQPVAEQQEIEAAGKATAMLVPGFDPANFRQVIDYAQAMENPEERAFYLGSPHGAVALAGRMMLEGKFAPRQETPPAVAPTPPPVPRRPMASISGSPVVGNDDNEKRKAQRVADKSPEEILAMLDRMAGSSNAVDIGTLLKP